MKKLSTGMLAVGLALGLSACGGGGSEPGDVVKDFAQAIADKDGEKVCGLLAPDSLKLVEEGSGKSCADAMKEDANATGDEDLGDPDKVNVKDTKIEGDKATVTTEYEGKTNDIPLVKVDGDWKIDLLGGMAGAAGG